MDKRSASKLTGVVVNKRWAAMEAEEIAATMAKRFCLEDEQAEGLKAYLYADVLMKGTTPSEARRLAEDLAAEHGARNYRKREVTRHVRAGRYPVLQQALARAPR